MPRRARRELGGGLAHLTCRTVRRLPLFLNARDARSYLGLLDHVTEDIASWHILAYCLMPNHVHLVVDAEIEQLSLAMHRVNGRYAQRFNRVHGFSGHLFQGRYHAKPIVNEAQLPGTLRYVVMNPVRAGLCTRPDKWRWSSYRATVGETKVPRFLAIERTLACFAVEPNPARAAFRTFVEHALEHEPEPGTVPGTVPGTGPVRVSPARG